MDSPFDFVKKMMWQARELNKFYDGAGEKITNKTKQGLDSNHWKQYVKAPNSKWFSYEFSNTCNTSILEAGTDCVGFAERGSSYTSNLYFWLNSSLGWTETGNYSGTDDIHSIEKVNRSYPYTINEKDIQDWRSVYSYDIINSIPKTKREDLSDLRREDLLKIIPGDIFVKGKGTSGLKNAHIAIVAYVPLNSNDLSISELLDQINIMIKLEIFMKKNFFLLFCLIIFISYFANSQNYILSEKENILVLEKHFLNYRYLYNNEENYQLSAPLIDENGSVLLTTPYDNNNYIYIRENGIQVAPSVYDSFITTNGICQNGYIVGSFDGIFCKNNNVLELTRLLKEQLNESLYPDEFFFVPNGIVFQWTNSKEKFNAVELEDGKIVKFLHDFELNNWLKNQNGNFTFNEEESCLYKNGIKWSLNSFEGCRFVGKLKSGHNVYVDGPNYELVDNIYIVDSTNNVVLKIKFDNGISENKFSPVRYSIGTYGELYFTIDPEIESYYDQRRDEERYNVLGSNIKIICVRNHLKYFGVLTDDRIRLRSEANTSSESLGTYSINTGFMILEKGTKQETIGGDTGVWYKVRLLDGKEGWFFGAYVRDLYDGHGSGVPGPS